MKRILLLAAALGVAAGAHGRDDQAVEEAEGVVAESAGQEPTAQQEYELEEVEAALTGPAGFFQRSADNITSQLRAGLRARGLFQDDPISRLGQEFQAFNEDLRFATRLDLSLAYTVLWQHASAGAPHRSAAAGDFDFFGTWHAIGEQGRTAGLVGFALEYRHNFGGITPSELNTQFGSLLKTTDGFNDHSFSLKQIWWQQHLADGRVYARIGDIDQSDFFSTNRFQSANFFFLNEAFSSSLAVPFVGSGLGVVAFGFPTDWIYVGAGIGDASPSDTSLSADRFDEEVFYALEVGFLTKLEGLGAGTYRFTVSHSDAVPQRNQPAGEAFAISLDQELGRFVPFLRLAVNNQEGLTTFSKTVSAGFGVEDPFDNRGDEFGLAVAWTEPENRQLGDEWVIESFYRLQLTPTLQFTPDLQFIINPSSGTKDVVAVGGLRFRFQY